MGDVGEVAMIITKPHQDAAGDYDDDDAATAAATVAAADDDAAAAMHALCTLGRQTRPVSSSPTRGI